MTTMNRRQFLALAAASPALFSLAACGNKVVTWDGTNFKHGFDKDFPPYSYIDDNGDTTGFDVELAQAVCEYKGWTYVPVPVNWDAKDAELNSGSCDCIWSGFTKSPAREDSYCWSEPYSINTQMIMVKEGSDIKTLADLEGKKVGVQQAAVGGSFWAYARGCASTCGDASCNQDVTQMRLFGAVPCAILYSTTLKCAIGADRHRQKEEVPCCR